MTVPNHLANLTEPSHSTPAVGPWVQSCWDHWWSNSLEHLHQGHVARFYPTIYASLTRPRHQASSSKHQHRFAQLSNLHPWIFILSTFTNMSSQNQGEYDGYYIPPAKLWWVYPTAHQLRLFINRESLCRDAGQLCPQGSATEKIDMAIWVDHFNTRLKISSRAQQT